MATYRVVEPGQVWSAMTNGRARFHFTIQEIRGGRVFGITPRGKHIEFELASLISGKRAVRLERNADGSAPAVDRVPGKPAPSPPERRPTVRVFRPRGVPRRSELTDTEQKILELRKTGLSRREIGLQLGGLSGDQVQRIEEQAQDILLVQKLRSA